MEQWQTLDQKVDEIFKLYRSGLLDSPNFRKYIRIPLTEQASLRGLDEDALRKVYHYCSSVERCKDRKAKTIEEHVVPIRTIIEIFNTRYREDPSSFTKTFIKEVLEKLLWVVFITKEEDSRLSKMGLKQKMPNGWNWQTDSPYARYEMAHIIVEYPIEEA